MVSLLDVNLLVALAWPNHVHHRAALEGIPLVGHRQVTDAHLLLLAQHRGGRLATLDGKIRGLVPRGHDASEVLSFVLEE